MKGAINMEIKQLKTFTTIAQTGSFIKSAKLLGYAQPTVTMHIQLLENEFNVRLFERLGHKIKLTQEGERLLYYAENILKFSEEATSLLTSNETVTGKIVIGVNECFSVVRLPEVLNHFRSACPEVDINLSFGPTKSIHEQLCNNAVDITFFLTRKMAFSDLTVETLIPEPVVVITSPNHPFASRASVSIEDFEDQDLITTPSTCTYREMLNEFLSEAKASPRSIIETNNIQAIIQFVMSGLGVSILPRVSAENEIAQGLLAEIPWKDSIPPVFTQIAYHKDKWLSPTILAFIEQAKKIYVP